MTSSVSALQNASFPIFRTAIRQMAQSGTRAPTVTPTDAAIEAAIVDTIPVGLCPHIVTIPSEERHISYRQRIAEDGTHS